eukprot:Blabericola_migrator_1__82@NODE_101_length_14318_cov_135_243281_g28_i1_p5_GENE_NODE_101_length_14318_cov_135_243281_g28_i1NODE_101_length_14318_cov_135_243281_g28_i1_p5_ORF_typecomplete_len499_score66_35Peptidase_C48/PF02902_19/5_1e39Acetyltransf_14/PF03421_16/0_21Peptidase_C5/PF00770_18/1_2Peptidase_C5/PF00770_18/2_7e02_NODE_101_length_14318_cov_135_243281_g28_i1993311429
MSEVVLIAQPPPSLTCRKRYLLSDSSSSKRRQCHAVAMESSFTPRRSPLLIRHIQIHAAAPSEDNSSLNEDSSLHSAASSVHGEIRQSIFHTANSQRRPSDTSPEASNEVIMLTPQIQVPEMGPRNRWSDSNLVFGSDIALTADVSDGLSRSQTFQSIKEDKELYKQELMSRMHCVNQHRSLFRNLNAKYVALTQRIRSSLGDQLRSRSSSYGKLIKSIPPPVFVELSETEEALVDNLLQSASYEVSVVSEIDSVQITTRDLRCLLPGEWLNDEVINAYMNLLNARTRMVEEGSAHDYCVKAYYWNTFFYSSLTGETSSGQREYSYSRVKRWTSRKKIDVFSYDLLLIPLHVQKIHWALGAVDFKSKLVFFFDSLGSEPDPQFYPTILQYLDDEHKDKKGTPLPDKDAWLFGGNNYSHSRLVPQRTLSHFRIFSSPDSTTTHIQIPQQSNGSDCGVFACQYAEALGTARFPFPFSARDIPMRRKRMALEILRGRIMFF